MEILSVKVWHHYAAVYQVAWLCGSYKYVCTCMCYTLQSNNNTNKTNTDICCFIRTQEALGTVRERPRFEFFVSSDRYRNHNLSDVRPCLIHTWYSSEQISNVFYLPAAACIFPLAKIFRLGCHHVVTTSLVSSQFVLAMLLASVNISLI